jgi:hypothetical protein
LLILVLIWLATASTGAGAQTISLAVDNQGTYTRSFDVVVSEPFDVVTIIDTASNEIAAAEWVQTEPILQFPGVFRLLNQVYCQQCCNICLGLDGCCGANGEYVIPLGECVPPSEDLVVARNQYFDVNGLIPDDFVLTIRGLQPGDTQPSSFNGSPGFYDCDDVGHPMVMSGGDAWETGSGVIVPSGALVLNPTPRIVVGTEDHPMTHLKALYR